MLRFHNNLPLTQGQRVVLLGDRRDRRDGRDRLAEWTVCDAKCDAVRCAHLGLRPPIPRANRHRWGPASAKRAFWCGRTDMIGDINSPTMTRRQLVVLVSSGLRRTITDQQPQASSAPISPFQEAIPRPRMIAFRFQVEQEGVDLPKCLVWIRNLVLHVPLLDAFPRLQFLHRRSHRPSGGGLVSRPTTETPRDKIETVRTTAASASPFWPNAVCSRIPALQPPTASFPSNCNLQPPTSNPQLPCPIPQPNQQTGQTTTPPATTASFRAPSRARTAALTWEHEPERIRSIPVLPPLPRPTARRPTADSPSSPRRASAVAAYGVP